MTDIYYPHDFLPMPQMDGYGFKPVSPLLRTKMTSGRARQRRLYVSTPTEASIKWLFTNQGAAQYFELWYRHILNDGASWFFMKLQTPAGLDTFKCRFTDIYEGPTLVPPYYWQFTATLEIWDRPVISNAWAEFPDFVVNADIIDLAVNREWPKK
ncbi:hypothetical protein ABU178_08530 [Pantoea osteomyelitidis]|uniref:Uncharacterized protein n=1 Tax=Pantoea osteomyelitidis TaxID=3230026 RepID=A0ABW7PV91_9GAMM